MNTIELDDYTIEGRSISTIETWVNIPELNVCFDIGKGPRKVSGTDHVMITHFHQDHALGLTKHIATRNLLRVGPPTIYVPDETTHHVHQLINTWQKLEERRLDYKLTGVSDADEYDLRKRLKVRVFDTPHSVESTGYALIEVRQKLRDEYLDLDGDEIVELKNQGENLFYNLEIPLVSYTGDSRPDVLDRHDFIQNSRVLICESTFLKEDDRKLAEKRSHTHLLDIIERRDQLKNQFIVLTHFSARYGRREVFNAIQNLVPNDMKDRVRVLA